MKKKNEQWLRYSNRALSGLLMLFGFVSCDNGGGDIPVEYTISIFRSDKYQYEILLNA